MSFDTLGLWRPANKRRTKDEQKKSLLKAKIAVALRDELGRVPKEEEIGQVSLLSRVMYKAVITFNANSTRKAASLQSFDFLL